MAQSIYPAVQTKNTEVLLIDGDQRHATFVGTALTDPSFRLTCSTQAGDVLGCIRKHQPDVILFGLELPECCLKELDVVRSISDLPVIVLCDKRCKSSEPAMKSGAQDCVNPSQITGYGLRRSIAHAVERHALQTRLRHCESLETAGQIAGAIAHDLNNLMMVTTSCSELALNRLPDGHAARRYIDMSRDATCRAASLLEELLACTRRRSIQVETVELNHFITRLVPMLRHLVRASVSLNVFLSSSPALIKVDTADLEQAIVNLVVNARDAMPDGGRLTLSTTVRNNGDEKHVVLTITDNGHGMDEETRARALEPFFTTKKSGKGTGVGLAMVDRFAAQTGASVSIASQPNVGTTISLTFPVGAVDPLSLAGTLTLPSNRMDSRAE